ncbi:uncharacterized protein LOC118349646 [Juglans regia]|uniref:Uncharacterized protein LOC118349646 n=1 Tax=Juglans regia TaxID=51240 RepID=A0A6P9ETR1_JUGRE|nr:uncharacterized protein LOC118349646 [Juglans regia]
MKPCLINWPCIRVEADSDGMAWGKCMRVRVAVDLYKPLLRGKWVHLEDQKYWISLKYERLQHFCFHCGILSHKLKGCQGQRSVPLGGHSKPAQFGPWLKADIPLSDFKGQGGEGFTFLLGTEPLNSGFVSISQRDAPICEKAQVKAAQSSDHSPLVMSLRGGVRRLAHEERARQRIFRFEASWNLHEECNNIIQTTWQNQPPQQNSNTGSDTVAVKMLQKDIDRLLEDEDVKCKQRAKQLWLKDGDRNSKFFHKCANQRRKTNEIKNLVCEDGRMINDDIGISEAFINQHYQAIFSTMHPSIFDECLRNTQPKVTEDMNNNLSRSFTTEEVKGALFQMNPLGSPGPDGFSAVFYQTH